MVLGANRRHTLNPSTAKHLIIVEGDTDKAVVEEIAKKIKVRVKVLKMRGNNPDKAARLANSMLSVEDYCKVIILKDEHKHPRETIDKLISRMLEEIQHEKKHPITVKKSIEAWILAGMGVANPENIDDPVEHLDHILRKQGKRYIKSPETARRLARHIDLQKAAQHSNTLKQFIETLKDC